MICHNGNFIESNPFINRATLFGDGFFESMRLKDGKIILESYHLKRIQHSCELLQLNCNEELIDRIKSDVIALIKQNRHTAHARVRVSIYRAGDGRYAPTSNEINYFISSSELDSFYIFSSTGIKAGFYTEQVKASGKYSGIKSLSSQQYVMASIYAQQNNFDEVVILNHEGNCIEGNTSNLFLIKDDSIITTPIADGCIDGVFRNYLIYL